MPDDIQKIIKATAKATAKEVRHEFDIVIENLEKGALKAINEQLDTHTKKFNSLEQRVGNMEKDITQVKGDVAAIKTTLAGTESEKPLKQRVEDLEAKRKRDLARFANMLSYTKTGDPKQFIRDYFKGRLDRASGRRRASE